MYHTRLIIALFAIFAPQIAQANKVTCDFLLKCNVGADCGLKRYARPYSIDIELVGPRTTLHIQDTAFKSTRSFQEEVGLQSFVTVLHNQETHLVTLYSNGDALWTRHTLLEVAPGDFQLYSADYKGTCK